jgi:predicted nucleic acid-binding protein
MVAAGFLRLVTSARVLKSPDLVDDGVAFIEALLAIPGVSMPSVGRPDWKTLCGLCTQRNLRGNNVSDAWIAAAVRATGGHLVTFDRDFARLLNADEVTFLSG